MAVDFKSFFDNMTQFQTPVINTYQEGYIRSNFDMMLKKMYRIDAVKKSRLNDFIYLETDKNFSKRKISQNLEKLATQISLSSQLVHMVSAQTQILGVTEYFPQNVQTILLNYQGLADTSVRFLEVLRQNSTFKQFGTHLAYDLIAQYTNKNITLNQLFVIGQKLTDYFVYAPPNKNTAIKELLSLGLQNFLPNDMLGIFDAFEYIALVQETFNNLGDLNTFNTTLENFLSGYSVKKLNTVSTPSNYNNVDINFNDPLGFVLQDTLKAELVTNFENSLQSEVLDLFNISVGEKTALLELVSLDYASNIDSALVYQGLPKISQISESMDKVSKNALGTYVDEAMETVVKYIFDDLGLSMPDDDKTPIDRLQNLHRFVKKHKQYFSKNGSISDFNNIDEYLKGIFPNSTYTKNDIEILSDKLKDYE